MSRRISAVRRVAIVQSLVLALAVALPASLQPGAGAALAADPVRQDGDLFVGAASVWDGFGNTAGGVYRVRGTAATLFCASPESSFDAGFWNIPNTLIVDSRGRIVFLAPIGGGNVGLMRCDQMGAPAERLALLRIRDTIPTGWPEPFPGLRFGVRIGSLHILAQRVVTDDLTGNPRVNNEDSYEFVAQVAVPGGDPNVPGPTQLFRMGAESGTWQTGRDLPDVLSSGNLVSVVAHGSDLWQSNGVTLRRTSMPYKLELTGTAGDLPYRVTYTPFGGVHEVTNAISDDTTVPNVSSGCNTDPPGRHDDVTDAMPWQNGFAPFPADPLIYDEYGDLGLVVNTRYGPMPGPYLTHVASALLNDDPMDDMQGYFHQPFDSCRHVPWIQFSPILPWTSPGSTVAFDNVADIIASAPGGMVGTSFWGDKVMRLIPGDRATDIVALVHPQGIAAYPAHVPSMGTIVYITVHSPVDVLVTDAAGRRIGADPVTGAAINDFGAGGFDSGPGEPRVFAINDPAAGAFTVSSIGTGTGPYQIDVASADLATASSSRITTTGIASPGVVGHHDFTLAPAGTLAFTHPATPPTVTPHVTGTAGADGWYTSDVAVSWDVADGGSGITSSTGCGPTSIVTDTAGVTLTCSATSAGGTGTGSVSVKRDATAPTIAATRTPAADPSGWSTTDVVVTFACTDATSGIASCASPATLTTEGRGQSVTGVATDRAGNTASSTLAGIDIDKTAPTTAATRTPAESATGWDDGDVAVALSASDALSGVAATEFDLDGIGWTGYAAPLSITTEGVHTLRYRSRDRAGNVEAPTTITIRIDRTPPEAVLRFDPTVRDVTVVGTDALAGTAPDAVVPSIVARAGEDEHRERRTYRVADAAGNVLALVIDVKRSGHELTASFVSVRYNDGSERLAGAARYAAEWSFDPQGRLATLEQEAHWGTGKQRQEVSAEFSARSGVTRIEQEGHGGARRLSRAGLALLRLTTDRGRVGVSY